MHEQIFARKDQKGFSLLELMIVLIMLGIVAGISAPAIGKLLTGLDFRKQVGKVTAHLRAVRLQAVVTGKDIEVSLEGNSLLLHPAGAKEKEEKELDVSAESEIVLEPEVIIFTPYSTVTPATIFFSLDGRNREIRMDPLTAMPLIQ